MNFLFRPVELNPKKISSPAKFFFLSLLLIGLACLSWAYWVEPGQIKITRFSLPAPQWKGQDKTFRIVVAGDLHLCPEDKERLETIVAAIQSQQPDAVLFVGDYVKGTNSRQSMPLEQITEGLAPLGKSANCLAVLGNHDEWQGGKKIKQALKAANFLMVEKKNTLITNKQLAAIRIAGIPDIHSKIVHWEKIPLMNKLSNAPSVFLSHTPDAVPFLVDKDVNLILCGHTHGGQICLPGRIPVVIPCPGEGKKYASGLHKKGNTFIYTTRGLGNSILPLRFFCPPEIAVITLSGQIDSPSDISEETWKP